MQKKTNTPISVCDHFCYRPIHLP